MVILVTTTVVVEVTLSAPVGIGTIAFVAEGSVPVVSLCPVVTTSLSGPQSSLFFLFAISQRSISYQW